MGENRVGNEVAKYSPRFLEGLIARMTKDDAKAQVAFAAARAEQATHIQAHPDDAGALSVLGLIDAALGRKEEALSEGRRAIELLPVEKDTMNGGRLVVYLAMIAAWLGDKDLACQQLSTAIRYPTSPSYGQLKLLQPGTRCAVTPASKELSLPSRPSLTNHEEPPNRHGFRTNSFCFLDWCKFVFIRG